MERKEFDESSARCKKCFQLGHYTYKCTASQIRYLQRPSRTKLLKKKWKDQERKLLEPKIDQIDASNENKPVEQDENVHEEKRKEKPGEEPTADTEKADERARTELPKNDQLRDDKLKETISEMNNEMRLNQESISKVINLIERDKKRKPANSSSSSSSSSDSSSSDSSSSSSSSSDDSDSSSSSSSSSSSDSSPARKKRRRRSGSRERRKR